MKLSEILEDYIKMINMYEEIPISPSGEIVEGGIYQLPGKEPLFLVLVNREGNFIEVAPLSFCWPLATRLDLIIDFPHPLSDTWIVQTDLAVSIPKKLIEEAELIGTISTEDLKILKRTLNGEAPLPKERRGRGYGDKVHERFKEFEYKRYRFLIEELISSIEEFEEISKSSSREVSLPKFLIELLEETAALSPAASSNENVLVGQGAVAVFTPEGTEVIVEENLVGKRGKVKVETKEGEVILFIGILPEVLTVKNLSFGAFKTFSKLKVEVES